VAAVTAGAEAFGRIDVVVNNAGYANLAAVEDMTLADFRAQVDANLFGVVNVTKAALPQLREQGGGHIIQVSSIGGRLATAGAGRVRRCLAPPDRLHRPRRRHGR
jgi:NAD(P)-dependent dehydrogenase (short-subunit alcohol dehydrogenase family)